MVHKHTRSQHIRKSVKHHRRRGGLKLVTRRNSLNCHGVCVSLREFFRTFLGRVNYLNKISDNLLDCRIPKSNSGQLIRICPQFVYKGPSIEYQTKNTIFWDTANKSMKIDFYSMNLLIQTALKVALKKDMQTLPSNYKTVLIPWQRRGQSSRRRVSQKNKNLEFVRRNLPTSVLHSRKGQSHLNGGERLFGKDQIRIEHWDSIVKDESNNWYMKSKKYSYNDPRFKEVSFEVKSGCIDIDKTRASLNAYNRIFKNMDRTSNITLTDKSGKSFHVKCYVNTNRRLEIANNSLNDGTYAVSKSLLNIEQYLQLSTHSDFTSPKFIEQGKTWFDQIRTTLQWAYDKIQLHHCDVKAEQFLLDEKGNAIVSDLDKATFTMLDDNNKPVRIRLHRNEGEKGKIMKYLLHSAKNIKSFSQFLPVPTSMQFEPYPRKNVDYECLCYLTSYLLLVGGEQYPVNEELYRNFATDLIDRCEINSSEFEINLDKLIHGRNKTWVNRKNFKHASCCVVYTENTMNKLTRHQAKYSPKWNEHVLNLKDELKSTVSLREISDMIKKEQNSSPIHQMKEMINTFLKPSSLKLETIITEESYMRTFIIGGPNHLDNNLQRFLDSEKLHVNNAAKKFYKAFIWRKSLKLFDKDGNYKHQLTEREFDIIYKYLECQWWFDTTSKRLFYYEKIGNVGKLQAELFTEIQDKWEEKLILYRILTMEYQSDFLNGLIHNNIDSNDIKLITIYDLSKVSLPIGNPLIRKIIKKLVEIGQNYYPELLHKAYIFNAPHVVQLIIKFVKSLVPKSTQDKITTRNPDTTIPQTNDNKFKKWCFPHLEQTNVTNVSINTWRPLVGNEFLVRAANWTSKNKLKEHSESALFDCVNVKLLNSPTLELENACPTFIRPSSAEKLIICVKLAKSNKSLVICFQRVQGNQYESTLFTSFLSECRSVQIKNKLPPNRFKVIINSMDGLKNKLLKSVVTKPVIIHNHGNFREINGIPMITIDMNIFNFSSEVTEENIKKRFDNCRFNVGFVIQGNTQDELPERIVGCVQFNKLNLDTSPTLAAEAVNQQSA